MHKSSYVLLALALAACAPAVPDSGSGVGFQEYSDYNAYRAQRDAELYGSPPVTVVPPPGPGTAPSATPGPGTTPAPTADTDTDGAPPPPSLNNPSISDEQDFDAVSNRQSIESDAERLKAQREAYQVINPTAVPSRSGSSGTNIVEYALSTSNPVGQKVWRRGIPPSQAKYDRSCGRYASPDLAQEAFLAAGGPKRDKLGLDPDGDGFACGWSPEPFRRAAAAAARG